MHAKSNRLKWMANSWEIIPCRVMSCRRFQAELHCVDSISLVQDNDKWSTSRCCTSVALLQNHTTARQDTRKHLLDVLNGSAMTTASNWRWLWNFCALDLLRSRRVKIALLLRFTPQHRTPQSRSLRGSCKGWGKSCRCDAKCRLRGSGVVQASVGLFNAQRAKCSMSVCGKCFGWSDCWWWWVRVYSFDVNNSWICRQASTLLHNSAAVHCDCAADRQGAGNAICLFPCGVFFLLLGDSSQAIGWWSWDACSCHFSPTSAFCTKLLTCSFLLVWSLDIVQTNPDSFLASARLSIRWSCPFWIIVYISSIYVITFRFDTIRITEF